MITNMQEFYKSVMIIVDFLKENEEVKLANDLEEALFVSQSSLEILGEVKNIIKVINKIPISQNELLNKEINQVEDFIKKYW